MDEVTKRENMGKQKERGTQTERGLRHFNICDQGENDDQERKLGRTSKTEGKPGE